MRLSILPPLAAALCAVLSAPRLLAGVPGHGEPERGSEAPAPLPLTTWRELSEHPGRYMNQHLRLVLQFQAHVATWNPYLTRFGTRDYNAYQFWGDEQRLWNFAEFQSPGVRLYARKHGSPDWTLEPAQTYVRFEVEIVVREIFLDQPWAEIVSAARLDERVSEGTIIHAARAIELFESRSWKLAENELDQALVGMLPPDPKRELEGLREECRQMSAPKGRVDRKPVPILRKPPLQPAG
jgi:hypothetical protein